NMADDVTKQGAKVVKVDKVSVPKNSAGFVDDAVDISRRGSYGQDIYDPFNPLNQDDFLSPYYRQKGSFGQNLDDMFDPMNKMDPLSPFYDSTGLGMF
ncbi:hypothetical protein IJZ97_02655, partial [bacterium]|nr:hypothetical protein [bacterium]